MRRWYRLIRIILFAVVLPSIAANAAEMVTLERDTRLRAEPSPAAPGGATLKQGAKAELMDKRGVWIHVKSDGISGWLYTFDVRYGERQAGSGQGDAAAVGRFASARPATTATIGIRGLSEEDLQKASFNAGEMAQLDAYVASRQAAEQQASANSLQPVKVEYFEARR